MSMKALVKGDTVDVPNLGRFTVTRWLSKKGPYWKLRLVNDAGHVLVLKVQS